MENKTSTNANNSSAMKYTISTAVATGTGLALKHGLEKARKAALYPMMTSVFDEAMKKNDVFKEAAFKALNRESNIRYVDLSKDFLAMIPIFNGDMKDLENLARENKSFPSRATDFIRNIKRSITPKFIESKLIKSGSDNMMKGMDNLINGKNAANLFDKVGVNFDKVAVAAFHEAGHAKNYLSNNLFTKIIRYLRHPFFIKLGAGAALASAVLIPPKKDNEESTNLLSKGLDFLKEHCVGLAALSVTPLILEEGLASIKGYKIAKDLLPAKELRMLNVANAKALSTYVLGGAVTIASVWAADRIKNLLS